MKADMMRYKDYRAVIAYDEEDGIFVGEVFGISDSLNFHGTSVEELQKSFHDCIENYIEECRKLGKKPEKEYTGSFNVRTTPALHEKASLYAAMNGCSLNQVVSLAIEAFLNEKM